ncbi:MAG: homoserine kinase [Hyphomonadaceae bacterium]
MAVYTHVSDEALAAFLADYDIGEPRALKGIAEGVENSNFFLETTHDRYILTLFEKRANPEDLPWFVALTEHLASKGFPCASPIKARDGKALRTLEGKPALIVEFLTGISPRTPNVAQCRAFGRALANMHLALQSFTAPRANDLGPDGWRDMWTGRAQDADKLQAGLSALINDDMALIAENWPNQNALPSGAIHADLFPDNTFYIDDSFTGAFDFYFACTDFLAYDLAVCLNAWVFEDGTYNTAKGTALIAGYQSVRPLNDAEHAALPLLARGAAIRFFLTRLVDWYNTPADALVKPHDPLDFAARLRFHRQAKRAEGYGYASAI